MKEGGREGGKEEKGQKAKKNALVLPVINYTIIQVREQTDKTVALFEWTLLLASPIEEGAVCAHGQSFSDSLPELFFFIPLFHAVSARVKWANKTNEKSR